MYDQVADRQEVPHNLLCYRGIPCPRSINNYDRAEKLADNEDILARAHIARLPIQYVKTSTMSPDDPIRAQIIEKFFKVVDKEGITHISEGMTMDAYKEKLTNRGE